MPKNNNTPETNNKRGPYRRFDGPSKLIRQSKIRGYATRYLDIVAKNNSKCDYGFMAELVREASSVTDVLQITRSDIRNEVARIVEERRKVSLEISGMPKVSSTINEPLDAPRGMYYKYQLVSMYSLVQQPTLNHHH